VSDKTCSVRRLERFYGEMTSVDAVLRGLGKDGASGKVAAADLYTRSLDVQNLGGFEMLERTAALAAESAALDGTSQVLDVGCGVGGPGRYLADRFGCTVTGIDLLPERIQVAAALTKMVGLTKRVAYRQADATDLPFSDAAFDQAWMLDASVHVADKGALFRQLARVLKPQGLLVMHDHIGPLPPAMRPVTRRAPYIAPSLPQMLRYIERGSAFGSFSGATRPKAYASGSRRGDQGCPSRPRTPRAPTSGATSGGSPLSRPTLRLSSRGCAQVS